jgi:hypothetical protein
MEVFGVLKIRPIMLILHYSSDYNVHVKIFLTHIVYTYHKITIVDY